jgi:signal transduction histidine kinase
MKQIVRTILSNKPLAVVVIGFIMTIATFIGNILLTINITRNLRGNVGKVEMIYSQLTLLAQIENDISFAENTLKNYYISKQVIYLRSHDRSVIRLQDAVKELAENGSKGVMVPSVLLDKISRLIKERTDLFYQTRLILKGKFDRKSNVSNELIAQGADKTLEIREVLHKYDGELKVSLEINRKYINRSISFGSYTNYLAICIALVVAFFSTVSITQDFLRQKEIERILRQLNDDKTKLFSILGHDLRSPLSGLNAIIYILKNHRSSLAESEIKDYIDQLEQTSNNYGKLLEDVLTWSRLQLNKIQINPLPFEIKLLGQEVIDLYQEQLNSKNIAIHNMVSSDLVLNVDKAMIQTVLRNLISNAIKFTNAGGEIWLTYREDKEYYYVEVQDNGVGMPAGILRTLFTNSTISMAGTENEVGTGLGLSICKEFISKQDGDLRVKSEENKGSVFSIVLPKEETLKKIKKMRSLLPGGAES